jgi:hypothetical protein
MQNTMRNRFLILPLLLLSLQLSSQLTITPSTVNFFTVYTDEVDSVTITISNPGTSTYTVKDINLYHPAFSISDTAFSLAPGGSQDVTIHCAPRHNMRYADYLYIIPSDDPRPVAVFTYAFARYRDTYYDVTHNKSNEELKAALHSLISTGTTDLGYTNVRDKMFMEVDNWKVNGHGAAVNTLPCIYTDSVAVGYTSRSDCQTNDQFNTEHTFPQSFFGSSSPMLSDMHHLFPTKDFANSERANKPFGWVTSPSWTNSGSKSNSTTFEPKDAQKGVSARAILYFVTRYEDYGNFCDSQEPTLYEWSLNYLPTYWDSIRNEDIYALQGNRNPYIDHPEFLERIASVCSLDSGYTGSEAWWTGDTLNYGSVAVSSSSDGLVHVSNQGKQSLSLSGFVFSDPAFSLVGSPSATIVTDSMKSFTVRFSPTTPSTTYFGTLTITTNDAWHPTLTIPLMGNSSLVANDPANEQVVPVAYPQPADGILEISHVASCESIQLVDLAGRSLITVSVMGRDHVSLGTSTLPNGVYVLLLNDGQSVRHQKVMVTH